MQRETSLTYLRTIGAQMTDIFSSFNEPQKPIPRKSLTSPALRMKWFQAMGSIRKPSHHLLSVQGSSSRIMQL